MVTGQWSNYGFYGNLYEGGPGVTSKTFLRCGLWGFGPRTPSEELSVLLILPLLGLLLLWERGGGREIPFPLGSSSLLY